MDEDDDEVEVDKVQEESASRTRVVMMEITGNYTTYERTFNPTRPTATATAGYSDDTENGCQEGNFGL